MAADAGASRPALRLAILVDRLRLALWQADALAMLPADTEVFVYSCTNGAARPGRLRHGLYRALGRVDLTSLVPVRGALPNAGAIREFALSGGHLPAGLAETIAGDRPDAILWFGPDSLRLPPAAQLCAPVIFYDHGQAPGFHATVRGRPTVGQAVRILADGPNSGPVASAETKVHPHSYRATLREAYRHARLLLPAAIRNARGGRVPDHDGEGRGDPLPGNAAVLRLILLTAMRKVARIAYGAFVLKERQTSIARSAPEAGLPPPEAWRTLPIPDGYRFLADPFFHPRGDGILAEAMHGGSGKGEILHVGGGGVVSLSDPAHHHSYPLTVAEGGVDYLLPEIADWSSPRLFRLGAGEMTDAGPLAMKEEAGGLLDPTLVRSDGTWFLFANRAVEGNNVLRLWWSETLQGPYEEHPESPVRISPLGARMGGAVFESGGSRMRPGQDFSRRYGDGLVIFRIEELSRTGYRETPAGTMRFEGVGARIR